MIRQLMLSLMDHHLRWLLPRWQYCPLWWGMVSVWCVVVGRGAIKSPDTQRAHVIPNSHFGTGTDYRGFQGNLIGTYGKSCQKGAHNSYLRTTCLTAWNSVGRMVLLSKTRQTHVKTGPVPCLVR